MALFALGVVVCAFAPRPIAPAPHTVVGRSRAHLLAVAEEGERPPPPVAWTEAELEAKFGSPAVRLDSVDKRVEEQRARSMAAYDKQKLSMLFDHAFLSALGASVAWAFGDARDLAGYAAGAVAGLVYLFLLQRTVDAVGTEKAGFQQGPPPILAGALLLAAVAKNRAYFSLFPAIVGFGAYKLATIAQGLYPDAETRMAIEEAKARNEE